MKRTMIYLSDETHQGLRKLAFEANTSIADLIRKAVDAVYGEDIGDVKAMEEEIANYRAHPESAVGLDELLAGLRESRRRKKVNV